MERYIKFGVFGGAALFLAVLITAIACQPSSQCQEDGSIALSDASLQGDPDGIKKIKLDMEGYVDDGTYSKAEGRFEYGLLTYAIQHTEMTPNQIDYQIIKMCTAGDLPMAGDP